MEKWILEAAQSANIQLTDLELPTEIDELRKITKTAKSEDNDAYSKQMTNLFKALKIANPIAVAVLSLWVTELRNKNYSVDLQELIDKTKKIIESK